MNKLKTNYTYIDEPFKKMQEFLILFPQPICFTKIETGNFEASTNSVLKLTGYKEQELLGSSSVEKGLLSIEQRDIYLSELKRNGVVNGVKMNYRIKDGSIIHALQYSKIICFKDNR